MKKKTIIISTVSLAVVILLFFSFSRKKGSKDMQFHTAQVEEACVEMTVTATGYVQPVDKVEVGTQVSGVIEKIFVDYNSQVKKGQLLAEIDKSTLIERVTQAKAGLTSAESDLKYTQQSYDRAKQLYDVKAATEASYEEAVNRLAQAETALANAKANLHQAQVNFSYAEIYSPIDGVILDRSVEQGQTVAASFNTPTLFTIANDLTKMQVEANVDEADIGRVRLGQQVRFTVDAYNEDTFEGVVNQIRLQPAVTNNVVTYTVIIEAPNPEEKLYPGMTASITIITQKEEGWVVPAEALLFVPTPEVFAYLKMKPELPASGQKPDMNRKSVWLQTPDSLVCKEIITGLSDGVITIVKDGLKPGDTVVLSTFTGKPGLPEAPASNPFMPRPPQRR
ncbi:MAG: efflux RND transporter periplasmic adaptor subunit [Dysgonamonadaceae bacterium]|jgi:HlyD family secretion protein|nr:efflux RND transporter periplasmic adaptor subunit [Dysgonamonadaceae bacterium]